MLKRSTGCADAAMSAAKYLVYATVVSIFAVFIWGAFLSGSGFGNACGVGGSSTISSDWPYCNGSLGLPSNWPAQVEYIHRAMSIVATVLLVGSNIAVWRMKPRPTGAAPVLLLALVLLLVEIYLGGVVINDKLNVAVGTLSLTTATTVFGLLVVAGDRMYLFEKRPHPAATPGF
jgi:heme A synthase